MTQDQSFQVVAQIKSIAESVKTTDMPDKLKQSILLRAEQLSLLTTSPTFMPEFDRFVRYVDWIVNLPWNKRTQDNLDLTHAQQILDKNHYGLSEIKDRILEYISIMKLKKEKGEEEEVMRAPILCFVGLVGTGKTTIAYSIAEALNRKFFRIPFGGMESPFDLRGVSRMNSEAEPGKIMKALRSCESRNPVILLDEIDRVTDIGRASIMGVLVELLDPGQNFAFADHYIDFPIDLSEVIFIATANNTHHIATAVLDRLEPIMMPSYTDQEKLIIAQKYILPRTLEASGVSPDKLEINDSVWPAIIRPLGYDAGTRTMERTIQGVVRKVAKLVVEGKVDRYVVTPENIKEFLPH